MKIFKLLKRWFRMLCGKSAFHVKQGIGKYYSKQSVKGYYNDLTNKVCDSTILDSQGIPINTTIAGIEAYFPITIFQYGLGLYDLYLETHDKKRLSQFLNIAKWAISHLDEQGMWNCMATLHDQAHFTQSSMCQSEGVSVLLRAYVETQERQFLEKAKLALDFMLRDTKNGGTTLYRQEDVIFQEYVSSHNLSVLNGWIFSLFGLYDFTLISEDKKYQEILMKSVDTLCRFLPKYDRGFWSNYDLKKTIASPAYHDLHIMQLELLFELFQRQEFTIYATKWSNYQKKKLFQILAMMIKLKQKIFKSKYYDINTSLVK